MTRLKRKRNIHFGFLPARPTRADLVKSRREFKARVRQKVKEQRAQYSRWRKSARAGSGESPYTRRKLEQLFHEVYGTGENPRVLPAVTAKQLAAFEKLIKGKTMAQKKKSKKKNPRKGRMPAALKAYWAKKRRAKAKRRNPAKRKRARARVRTRTIIKYRTRVVKVRAKRRRTSNPRSRVPSRLNLGNGFTAGQIKKVARAVARITGKRTRIVKP
jgi:hypothetical protein